MDGAVQQRSSPPPGARPPLLPTFPGSWLQTSARSGKLLRVNQVGMTRPAMLPCVDNRLCFGDLFSGCGWSWKQGEEERVGCLAGAGGSSRVSKKEDFCRRGSGDGE